MSDTSVIFSILAVEKVSQTLGKIPGAAALSGAAIGAALMGAVNKAMDQESAANVLAAQLGGGQETAAQMGKIAGNLYSQNFGESIADIDEALKAVIAQGVAPDGATDAELQSLTAKVVTAAKVMGASYDEVSRAASQMIRTGLAKSSEEAIDTLVAGMQMGVNKSDDLLDTFNEYPTEFRKLGITGVQAMGLLSQAIQAGARDSDVAADALKEFSIRAVDGSKTTAQGFQMLGLSASDMAQKIAAGGPTAAAALDLTLDRLRAIKDPVKQSQAAVALFGTQAEDLGKALFAMDPSAAVGTMGKVAGAADKAGKTLSQGAGAQIEQFKRKLEQGFVNVLGGEVIPKLDKFSQTIQQIGTFAKDNWAWLGPIVVTLGTFAGVIGTIVAAVKVWKMVTEAYTAVQAALNVVMDANPIGLIVIAIAALVAGLIYAWNHSETFRKVLIGAWNGIKDAVGAVAAWFAGPFVNFFVQAGQMIAAPFLWLWHNVIDPAFQGISAAFGFVGNIISSAAHLWAFLWQNTVGAALLWLWHSVVEPAFQGIGAVASWVWNSVIKPVFDFWMGGVKAVGSAAMWLWHNAIEPAFQGVAAVASWVWNKVISPTFSAIVGAAHWLGGVFSNVFHSISGWISSAFSGAASIVKGAMNGVISVINGAIGGLNSVINLANKVPGVNFPHLPTIPHLATGGTATSGGLALVGEKGAEVVSLPTGSTVYPHGTGPGGGVVELRTAPGDQVAEALLSLLRPTVRGRYGGNVTAALGGAK